MNCRGCGNEKAYNVRTRYEGEILIEGCDQCGSVNCEGIPDVYLNRVGQTFSNLCDTMGNPIPIMSKRHKQEVMKSLGVSEAGDRVNGAPYGSKSWVEGTRDYSRKTFEKDRPMIRKVYQQYLENVRKRNGR